MKALADPSHVGWMWLFSSFSPASCLAFVLLYSLASWWLDLQIEEEEGRGLSWPQGPTQGFPV